MSSPSPYVTPEEVLAHAGFLRRLTRDLVADPNSADDLTQATLLVALRHPPAQGGSLRGWLATVARNLAHNARRSDRKRLEREHVVARSEVDDEGTTALERLELQRAILEHVMSLPVDQRTVLYLRYYEGATPSEIAARLDTPLKTIKSRHTRGLAALRARLEARYADDPTRWMTVLAPLGMSIPKHPFVPVLATTVGGIAMKKVLAVVGLVLLAALSWWIVQARTPEASSPEWVAVSSTKLDEPRGDVPMRLDGSATQAPRQTLIPAETPATGTLELHLTWSDGAPAADVGFEVTCSSDPAPREEPFRGVTDDHGVAIVPGLFAGPVSIDVDMRDHDSAVVVAHETTVVRHGLSAGITVSGRVVDVDGNPVAGASIWHTRRRLASSTTREVVHCESDGSFVLRDLGPFSMIGARARGHAASLCVGIEAIPVNDAGTRTIDLRLGPAGGRVRGTVSDPDGKAIAGARIKAGPTGGLNVLDSDGRTHVSPDRATIESSVDGTFEIVEDLPAGTHAIHVTARGYPVWNGQVHTEPGETANVEIHLQRPTRIEGRVLGVEGTPIAGVHVIAAVEERGGWVKTAFQPSECVSDDMGRYVLDWVTPGDCELNASDSQRPEIGRARGVLVCSAGALVTCDLELALGNTIRGRVIDDSGAPIAGWSVSTDMSLLNQWYQRHARTSTDGTFLLCNLGSGRVDLNVRGPKGGDVRARATGVAVGSDDVELVVSGAHDAPGTLRGRIVDVDRRRYDDVQVTVWRARGREGHFATIDPSTGRFEIEVTAGRYRVEARRTTGVIASSEEVEVVQGSVCDIGDCRVPIRARLELRLQLPPAAQLPITHLGLIPARGGADATLRKQGDLWVGENLLPGRWYLDLTDAGYCFRDTAIEVAEGTTTSIERPVEFANAVPLEFSNDGQTEFTIEARDEGGHLLRTSRVLVDNDTPISRTAIYLPTGQAAITVSAQYGTKHGTLNVDVTSNMLRGPRLRVTWD